ncbi:phosphonate metabolism protein/1,5-bisphosphokinase (PRPP-forming) PhnN [Alsobacter sp. R-9]
MSSEGSTGEPRGPGPLVLVVGPSGAGKDTLLEGARALLHDRPDIVFARRVVTRPGSASEDHDTLTPEAFAAVRSNGGFSLWWSAHGLDYGIPANYADEVSRGRCVVANGSRAMIGAARAAFRRTVCVLITAPAEVLSARLAARARRDDVASRLARTAALDGTAADHVIENTGTPEEGSRRLAAVIRSVRDEATSPFPLWGP